MDEWMTLEARITEHLAGAMFEHFADGSFAMYAATVLEVEAPPAERGRVLTLFHDGPVEEGSLWIEVGARVRFEIPTDSLAPDRQVFAGAVRGLARVEP